MGMKFSTNLLPNSNRLALKFQVGVQAAPDRGNIHRSTKGDDMTMQCSICHQTIEPKRGWDRGNDAAPINDGRCCDDCNDRVVIPARLQLLRTANAGPELQGNAWQNLIPLRRSLRAVVMNLG